MDLPSLSNKPVLIQSNPEHQYIHTNGWKLEHRAAAPPGNGSHFEARAPIFAYLAIKSQKCRTEIPLRLIATWRRRLRLIATIPLTIHLRMRRSRWISVKGWSRWICFILYARINTSLVFHRYFKLIVRLCRFGTDTRLCDNGQRFGEFRLAWSSWYWTS